MDLFTGQGPRPDPERLFAALAITRQVAALAPRASQPGALAACAWLTWALGGSTHAAHYAGSALRINPDHGLADIITRYAELGHLPEWAFHPGTCSTPGTGHIR